MLCNKQFLTSTKKLIFNALSHIPEWTKSYGLKLGFFATENQCEVPKNPKSEN